MSGAQQSFKILWGMAIDLDKCTGCGACMVACQAENNLAPEKDASNKRRVMNWLKVYELSNGKAFPDHDTAFLPRPCQQCGNPACVPVCPATVTKKDEEGGIVSQVYPRCFGCRYCMAACPYKARYFNWYDPEWPQGWDKTLSPDVSVRPRGVVEKCTFCHHRWMKAKDKARVAGNDPYDLPEGAYVTACTESCPNGAIVFGDLNNPKHLVHKLAHSEYAFRLLERLGMDPQVYYLSRREWVRRLGDHHLDNEKTGDFTPLGGGHHG
ncbi:menaquinone reductase iron-sulfur cluster-binding subunit QrcC [Megalodesulfovibrio gigas]|uniref:Putative molybdopterin oxidoreductase, iron-sulfur cluster-binding subunit n=2 Tax=Megalodesulfovibrio gigas TaxID=879 RepID=T2G737_MEGG1|nr:menaquinone reductase iron-sulfur cluster-binding subunit QrcC [Megalodesulfovibrio gigas]AGS82802.1 putative molybdopterin oxidoreductase iron-sulfur cluster-binding subunit [Megalodesulfovibrio gigas]AGW12068.1 putative molybdopterin oxidoreductase, iron-sulfur cluster-binding subunit [Megalodesulfovibrio gigas DSM 1382 = ATCC 19364]